MKVKSHISALLLAGAALSPLAAVAAEFTIASIKALTGPLAFVGVPEANAVKMAVDELNAANYLGAGNSIKLISNDDQNDRAQLTTLLTRSAKVDNALIVLGGANSVLMIAIAPLLKARPELMEFLSKVLAEREAENSSLLEKENGKSNAVKASIAHQLLRQIRAFFSS